MVSTVSLSHTNGFVTSLKYPGFGGGIGLGLLVCSTNALGSGFAGFTNTEELRDLVNTSCLMSGDLGMSSACLDSCLAGILGGCAENVMTSLVSDGCCTASGYIIGPDIFFGLVCCISADVKLFFNVFEGVLLRTLSADEELGISGSSVKSVYILDMLDVAHYLQIGSVSSRH